MFDRLGTTVSRHWLPVLACWVVLGAILHLCAPAWDRVTCDGDFEYLPAEMTSVRGTRLLHEAFPQLKSRSALVFVLARGRGKLRPEDFRLADRLVQCFAPPEILAAEYPAGKRPAEDHPSRAGNTPPQDHPLPETDSAAPKTSGENGESNRLGRSGPVSPSFPATRQETERAGAVAPSPAKTSASVGRDSGPADEQPQNPVVGVWDYRNLVVGSKLLSPAGEQGQAALVILQLREEFMSIANMRFMQEVYRKLAEIRRAEDFPPGLRLGVTGSAAIGADMLLSAEKSIRNTERTTILLVVLILLVVYRAPGLVVVPLATIAVSFSVGLNLLALLAHWSAQLDWLNFQVFKTTRIFIIVILFGAGTDYCLFLIARYRELLEQGLDAPVALQAALGRVGRALAASGLTTIVGLGTMLFADFGKFRNGGPAIALCLLVTLAACVTLAPALLRAAGPGIFWPFTRSLQTAQVRGGRAGEGSPVWHYLAERVLRRPGLILVVSLLLLAPLAGYGLRPQVTYDLLAELGPDSPSVRGTALLRQHFLAGQISPVTVLAVHPQGRFDTTEGEQKIARLTRFLYELEYTDSQGRRMRPILAVRSLTEPLGDPPGSFNPLSAAGRTKLAVLKHPRTIAQYRATREPFAGKVTRFDLILPWDPFRAESIALLEHIEEQLDALQSGTLEQWPQDVPADWRSTMLANWRGAHFEFCGTTASLRDLQVVTQEDQARIQQLVLISVLAVLIVLLRRPVAGYHGLDWKVPIFLFVLLVALGADYNIYLVTRAFEEQARRGAREGLRVALVRTGGIITSCGIIMAGTFASMGTGTLRAMQQLGFALAFGVLLDTFLIRTILVPAFLALWTARDETADREGRSSVSETGQPAQDELRDKRARSHLYSAQKTGN